ncbi:Gfo/Idh/MocA family oxidoreductase [Luteolibacter sp. SL250]|uniref:Gfo/Idh/MocA family protein n=1 Tax=Luteolibacter sp. SL250 TaxID=2995170 RepID=UPI00226E2C52|nr:Gfo/Idh/MocA family oxidoreductase [Luteolibacter sp. SL250]WAC19698.1 Gfo/Idh/MocA family oxidoreductase [Luteolibacter sp. SL250]
MKRRSFLSTTVAAGVGTALARGGAVPARRPTVGIIGHTGRGDYGHGIDTGWLNVPETEIVAVADAHEKGLEAALKRLGVERGFTDYREMLRTVRPELVAIGPRHIDQHRDMLMAAIGSGAKGIYMEKPFCRDLAECDEVIAALEESGTKLTISHRTGYHPAVPAIKQAIESGGIGKVLEIRMRGKEDKRGGVQDFWVLGTHLLNLSVIFAGKPTACHATLLQNGRPVTKSDLIEGQEGIGPIAGDEIHVRYETESGIPVFYDGLREANVKEASFGMQIIGNDGLIDIRCSVEDYPESQPLAHLVPGCPHAPPAGPREWIPITSAGVGKPEPVNGILKLIRGHRKPITDLLAAIDEDRQPLCGAPDGRLAIEMVVAAFESHRRNGARVTFPLTEKRNPLYLL